MINRIKNLGLQKRIMVYVTAGLLVLVSMFAYVAQRAVDQSTQAIFQERLSLAETIAHDIDGLVQYSMATLIRSASLLFSDFTQGITPHEEAMLQSMISELTDYYNSQPPETVVLIDSNLSTLWEWSREGNPSEDSLPPPALIGRVLNTGDPIIQTANYAPTGQEPIISIIVPLYAQTGGPKGALALSLVPTSAAFIRGTPVEEQERVYRVEMVATDGTVIAASDRERLFQTSRHLPIIAPLINDQAKGVQEHLVSDTENGGDSEDHIVAFVPLKTLPWGVVLEQKEDVALALPRSLQRRMFFLSGLAIFLGLLFAWITTRQVVRPLVRLTATSRRIASGDLSSEVPDEGQDEVRTLANSFEAMRVQLKSSLEEIEEWNRALETRVQDRTRELEQRNQERSQLLKKVILAQEEERKRVARELHDGVGQALTALVMRMGSAEEIVGQDAPKARQQLEELRLLTSETIEDVRRLISALRPSVLDDMGLVPAVRWYVDTYLDKAGVKASLTTTGQVQAIPSHVEISVFRVIQEALTNIIRHSQASKAEIVLDFSNSTINGRVTDDGVGFDVPQTRQGANSYTSVGLLGMEERANLLGGKLRIDSQPGRGTSITFEGPLTPDDTDA